LSTQKIVKQSQTFNSVGSSKAIVFSHAKTMQPVFTLAGQRLNRGDNLPIGIVVKKEMTP
jgi:hypothetical protein